MTAEAATPKRLPDVAYRVYIGQFQQISVLAMALAGGVLVMHQMSLFGMGLPRTALKAA